jgi:xanthine dehydrogenase iron-sulfur cluster and FAD-binding subunit A
MSMTQTPIRLTVNGRIHDVDAASDTALLYVLRNDLELNGPKFGCGLGECGALRGDHRRHGRAFQRDSDQRLRRA